MLVDYDGIDNYIYIDIVPPETYLFDIFIGWLGQKGVTLHTR